MSGGRSTKAEQFGARVHGLRQIYKRIEEETYPLPSASDVTNYLKYFHQILLSLAKETPPLISADGGSFDHHDIPNLEYTALFTTLVDLLHVIENVGEEHEECGLTILHIMTSLVPFLPESWLNDLPITLTTSMATISSSLHGYIMKVLCGYLLPILLGNFSKCDNDDSYFALSCSSLIMSVLLYCKDPKEHAKFLETMMRFKKNVCLDLLAVMAYGPTEILQPSVQLLFHYYPSIDVAYIFFSFAGAMDDSQFYYDAWNDKNCSRPGCEGPTTKLCIDAQFASRECDTEPPLFICDVCANMVKGEFLLDIVQPIGEVAASCENKPCKGADRTAKYTCFSQSCFKKQRYRPLAMCRICTQINHDTEEGQDHVVQGALPDPWSIEGSEQTYLVDAIVRLLKQAPPDQTTRLQKIGHDIEPDFVPTANQGVKDNDTDEDLNRGLLLSRFGVWILASQCRTVSLCKSEDRLGYLISVVFDWMTATADIADKGVRGKIETLKKEYISNWINVVKKANLDLYCTCLFPDPPSFVQMQGISDLLASRIRLLKEGLYRICCLIPYNLVPQEVWERIMPEWMNAIRNEVPPERLREFKTLLSDMFDPVVSPFKVSMDVVMAFIKTGFESGSEGLQRQTLTWLQILSEIDIIIKIQMLVNMFQLAVDALRNPGEESQNESPEHRENLAGGQQWSAGVAEGQYWSAGALSETDSTLASFIMMLDILAKQIKLQYRDEERVANVVERQSVKRLLGFMLDIPWSGSHDHNGPCRHCQMIAMWFQLAHSLMDRIFPQQRCVLSSDKEARTFASVTLRGGSIKSASEKKNPSDGNGEDVETSEQGTDSDKTKQGDDSTSQKNENVADGNAATQGSIRNSVSSMESSVSIESAMDRNPQIRFLLGVLKELPKQEDLVVVLHLVRCLYIMCIRGDYLKIAAEDDADILPYLQEVYLIPNLWKLLKCDRSELSEVSVPLLLYCIGLPCGSEALVNEVEATFTDKDWRVRFDGVSKVATIARYLQHEIFSNELARSSLALCFAYLVGAIEDLSNPVSLHVVVMLETIHSSCLRIMHECLMTQFDAFPMDRLLIIHTFRLLHNALPKRTPLSGNFFLRRFTQLFVEKTSLVSGSHASRTALSRQTNMSEKSSTSLVSAVGDTARKMGKSNCGANRVLNRSYSSSNSITICSVDGRGSYPRSNSLPINRCGYSLSFEKRSLARHLSNPYEASSSRHFKFDPAEIESVDQMLLGARIVQGSLSPVVEESVDGVDQKSENADKTLERSLSRTSEDEVVHQLVTLLCEFMSNPRNDSEFGGTQEYVISQIKHHLGLQMGYNLTDYGEFTGSPTRLRSTPVFSAFISGIAHVLDRNPDWGKEILPLTLQLLLFSPAPEVVNRSRKPNYTLGLLETHVRHSWLMSLLIYLYKKLQLPECSASIIVLISELQRDWNDTCKPNFEAFVEADVFLPYMAAPSGHKFGLMKYEINSHKELTKNLIKIVMNTINVQNHECSDEYSQKVGKSLSGVDEDDLFVPRAQPSIRRGTLAAVFFGSGGVESGAVGSPTDSDSLSGIKRRESELQSPLQSPSYSSLSNPLTAMSADSPFGIGQLGDDPDFAPKVRRHNLNKQSRVEEDVFSEGSPAVGSLDEDTPFLQKRAQESSMESEAQAKRGEMETEISKVASEISKEFEYVAQDDECESPTSASFTTQPAGTATNVVEAPENNNVFENCPVCDLRLEQFDEETINLCIIVLSTFVHRNPAVSTPWLLRILLCVGRKVVKPMYPWQVKSKTITPLSSVEVAKQFLRCVLVKFAPNGLFPELFRTPIEDPTIFPAIAAALSDFPQFNQMGPIAYVLMGVNSKTLPDRLQVLLTNMASYLDHVNKQPVDIWSAQLCRFIRFFQKLPTSLPRNYDATPVLCIMSSLISAANSSFKDLLEPFGNVIVSIFHNCSFALQRLMELCAKCNDVFSKERNKLYLTKLVLQEILMVFKFKSALPEKTVRYLMQFLCFDAGTRYLYAEDGDDLCVDLPPSARTRVMDNFQHHIIEALDFIKDWNFTRQQRTAKEVHNDLEEPDLGMGCLGIHLKATVSQLWAIELTKPSKDNKMYNKTLSWLKTPPATTQLGRLTLLECDANIRLLSWLLVGSLSHTINFPDAYVKSCPVKINESSHIAEFVLIILANFADHSQDNNLGISALFHSFNLCLLWTLYCEHQFHSEDQEMMDSSLAVIMEFWGRITPGTLLLLQHSKKFTATVGEQFSHMLNALADWNSATLPKLFPLWSPVLNTCSVKVNDRIYSCCYGPRDNKNLFHWLKQNLLSMARMEQAATPRIIV